MTTNNQLLAEIRIEGLPKPINSIGRKHWTVKTAEAKKWTYLVHTECVLRKISGVGMITARLELTRHSNKEPDFDGLVSSFKHVIDGLVKANVIIDDKPSVIGSPTFKWERAPMGKGFITIKIWV